MKSGFSARARLLGGLGAVGIVCASATLAYASGAFSKASAPTHVQNHLVLVGGGQRDNYVNLQYTPNLIDIYAGDSVTFKTNNPTEPHTVTFGPKSKVKKLIAGFVSVVPSATGPPTIKLLSSAVVASKSHTVSNHTAVVNSGVLSGEYNGLTKKSWTAKFPKPGKYEYYCIVHGLPMHGWVVVHARPGQSNVYHVEAGPFTPNPTAADVFFPDMLTIHAGGTVVWTSFFHTVTFDSAAAISAMRHRLVLRTVTNGKASYQFNPAVVFPSNPSCGTTSNPCMYSGGFLNAGLLQAGPHGPATFAVTFPTPGTYHYGCLIHPGMDASIRVLPAVTGKG